MEAGCWEVVTAAEGTREVENREVVTLEGDLRKGKKSQVTITQVPSVSVGQPQPKVRCGCRLNRTDLWTKSGTEASYSMEGEMPEGGCWEVVTAAEGTREVGSWEVATQEEDLRRGRIGIR